MPRLKEVPRAAVTSPHVLDMYANQFGDRDPVTAPGGPSGTPGNWWTVFALDPGLCQLMLDRHRWQSSTQREIDPRLRELAVARTGWAAGSIFVFSQHCKALRRIGVSAECIAALPSWSSESCFSGLERVVLGYTDDLVLGAGRVSDDRFAALQAEISDVAILELTYIVTTYLQSATICRALRLEFDDYPDPVVEQS